MNRLSRLSVCTVYCPLCHISHFYLIICSIVHNSELSKALQSFPCENFCVRISRIPEEMGIEAVTMGTVLQCLAH